MARETGSARRQRRRRAASGNAPAGVVIKQLPWQQPELTFPPQELFNQEQLDTIHEASLKILKDIGMEFM